MANEYFFIDEGTLKTVFKNYRQAVPQAYEELYGRWKEEYLPAITYDTPSWDDFKNQFYSQNAIYCTKDGKKAIKRESNAFYTALRRGHIEKAKDIVKKRQFMSVKAFAEKHDIEYSFALKEIHSIWYIATGNAVCHPIPVALENRITNWIQFKIGHTLPLYYMGYNVRNIGNLDFFNAIHNAYTIALVWALIMCKDRCTLNNDYSELAENEIRIKGLLKIWNADRIFGLTDPSNIL